MRDRHGKSALIKCPVCSRHSASEWCYNGEHHKVCLFMDIYPVLGLDIAILDVILCNKE